MAFLPISKKDLKDREISELDFIIVTGDAYVDHPSFGTAIIGRVLESMGYNVGIIAQPNYHNLEDFKRMGRPRLGFLVNSGVVDSMVNNYSVFKNKRKVDEYSPGGMTGLRPDRAIIVYCNKIREAFGDIPIIIGGIEASLRRMGHYDYWSDKVRRSILLDSGADLLIYGMGERAVMEIAEALESGIDIRHIIWIRGTCFKTRELDSEVLLLPKFQDILRDKKEYAKSFKIQYDNNDFIRGVAMAEAYENGLYLQINPPQEPLSQEELDWVYSLPYERDYHPIYEKYGGVPAIKEVGFSIISNRGCFGGCSFCAITYHQGREVRGRSKESILLESEKIKGMRGFKGYIHDLGGPTANFRGPSCKWQLEHGLCKKRDCLFPTPCKNLEIDHREYLDILRSIRNIEGIKKVFIRSGIRYDYLMADKNGADEFIKELCEHHVSGTLKVAPEHIGSKVLKQMRKPGIEIFEKFVKKYYNTNERIGKKQYLIPYFISSHPGADLNEAIDLALFLKKTGFIPDQVQDFYPTPGTLSTCMYYTGLDPFTLEEVYVPRKMEEKRLQRALIHFHKKENISIVKKGLLKFNREDVIEKLYGKGEKRYCSQSGANNKREKMKKNNRCNFNSNRKAEKEVLNINSKIKGRYRKEQ